jgi:antitoxin (DNA-binding transcriptional repressor) of toxin-antitoxin stability system
MTVRDIRLKWPEAERRLLAGREIVVTRHAKPIARTLPCAPLSRNTCAERVG